MNALKIQYDGILAQIVSATPGVPGVVAMATSRDANFYEGAAGRRDLSKPAEMTLDTVFALYSTTKAVTATAVLQLVEEGLVDLDAPAKTYALQIGHLKVLQGFDTLGRPKLRAPKRDITTRMLLTHTAGLGYDSFNEHYLRLAKKHGQPSIITGTKASLMTPLLFDPGEDWEYGSNIDWCGVIVSALRGKRLGQVMTERIFDPLGMTSTSFKLTPAMRTRLARIHQRREDGTLSPIDFELPQQTELDMGGHGLYGTVGDYMRFIRMWLNDGAGEHGRVLKAETVRMAEQDQLGGRKIKPLPNPVPAISNKAEFFPPTRRPAGSLAWAGLPNLYYWIDRKNGIGGYWATQVFPFADHASLGGYLAFETAVYEALRHEQPA